MGWLGHLGARFKADRPKTGGTTGRMRWSDSSGRVEGSYRRFPCFNGHFAPQTSYWDEYTYGTPGVGVRSVHQAVQHERYMTKRLALGPYSQHRRRKVLRSWSSALTDPHSHAQRTRMFS